MSLRGMSKGVDDGKRNFEQSFLRSIIDGLPFALFCKDYTTDIGRFTAWNRRAELLWGLSYSSVIGKSDYDFFPKEQADFFKGKDLETLQSGKMVFIKEEQVDSPTLGATYVRTWKVPVVEEHGGVRFLLGISQDIADIKKIEDELGNLREKLGPHIDSIIQTVSGSTGRRATMRR